MLNLGNSNPETSLGDEESNAAAMIGPIVAIIVIVILVAVLVVVYVRRGRAIKLKSNRTSGSHIVNNEQEIVPDGMKVLKHVQYTAKPLENCETLLLNLIYERV